MNEDGHACFNQIKSILKQWCHLNFILRYMLRFSLNTHWYRFYVAFQLISIYLSAAILAKADLAGLCCVLVPQVLIPQHPAVIEGIAVGAVVVPISGVLPPTGFMTVVSLGRRKSF